MELGLCAPGPASSKMLKDTSRWDSPQSSAIWKNWVTKCRGEYSARLKSALPTAESGSSSWPTITVSESKNAGPKQLERNTVPLGALVGLLAPDSPSSTGNPQGSSDGERLWPTIRAQEPGLTSPGYGRGLAATVEGKYGHLAPDSPSSTGNHQGSSDLWPTSRAQEPEVNRPGEFSGAKLRDAVETHESWPSPTSRDWKGERGGADRGFGADLNDVVQKETRPLQPSSSGEIGYQGDRKAQPPLG